MIQHSTAMLADRIETADWIRLKFACFIGTPSVWKILDNVYFIRLHVQHRGLCTLLFFVFWLALFSRSMSVLVFQR